MNHRHRIALKIDHRWGLLRSSFYKNGYSSKQDFIIPSGLGVKIYSSPALVGKYQHISTCEIHLIQPSQGAGEADLKIWLCSFYENLWKWICITFTWFDATNVWLWISFNWEIDNTFHKKYLVQRAGKEKEENLNNIINMGIIVKGAVSSETKIGFV